MRNMDIGQAGSIQPATVKQICDKLLQA